MVEGLLQRAMAAFKAGRKDEARGLFMDIVEQDSQHEQAWLYLSALVDSLEEQQICLENVLTINPDNKKAQQGIATLKQKLSGQQKTPSSKPDPEPDPWANFAESAPVPDSAFTSPPDENLFGEPAFGVQSADSSSVFGSDFDFNAEDTPDTAQDADDPFSWLNDVPDQPDSSSATASPASPQQPDLPASSVDWGSDDQPATYGSGRQIDEPTADDYDSWVDNLPLGTETSPVDDSDSDSDSVFGATPFGDTSFMVEDNTYANDDLFGQEAPDDDFWNSSHENDAPSPTADDSFAAFGAQDSDFGARSPDTAEAITDDFFDSAGGFADDESDESGSFGSSMFEMSDDDSAAYFEEPEPMGAGSSEEFEFSFDDDDDMLEARLNAVASSPSLTSTTPTPSSQSTTTPTPSPQPTVDYYRLIPP
jgi:hypothetical protein